MADGDMTLRECFSAIGSAIREKLGTSEEFIPTQMPDAIRRIGGGGGGGLPQGTVITAQALKDLQPYDLVYIKNTTDGGDAAQIELPPFFKLNDGNSFAYDGKTYIYFTDKTNNLLYRVPKDSLTATPTIISSYEEPLLFRNLLNYKYNSNSRKIINLSTNEELLTQGSSFGWGSNNASSTPSGHTQFYFCATLEGNSTRIVRTDDFNINMNMRPNSNGIPYTFEDQIFARRDNYQWYLNGTQIKTVTFSERMDMSCYNIIGKYLITLAKVNNDKKEICYTNLLDSTTEKFINPLTNEILASTDSEDQAVVSPSKADGMMEWNAEGTKLYIELCPGLAIIDTNLKVKVYPNLYTNRNGAKKRSCMFYRYFFNGYSLYDLGTEDLVMDKPATKQSPGQLGYVTQAVSAGQLGQAVVLFS